MAAWLGPAISAGASIIGGIMGKKSNDDANAFQREQLDYTKKLNKNKIQWQVEDAKAAGLHPLYALGSQTHSPSFQMETGSAMGNAIANAGSQVAAGISNNKQAKRQFTQDAQTRQLHQLQMIESAARANKDNAQAALFASEVKRGQQAGNYRQDLESLLKLGGANLPKHTGSNAQKAEDAYGNVIGEIFGLVNASEAAGKWLYHKTRPKKLTKPKKYHKSASQYRNVYR